MCAGLSCVLTFRFEHFKMGGKRRICPGKALTDGIFYGSDFRGMSPIPWGEGWLSLESFFTLLKYALLGLLQGVTEPIPVSSSGHLVIAEHLFGVHPEGMSFEVLVNFASLIAVLMIYQRDLVRLLSNSWAYLTRKEPQCRPDFMFMVYLVIGTIPAAVIGFLFEDAISEMLKGLTTIGVTLLITGAALWLIRNLRGRRGDRELSLRDALIVGMAQAAALIPGISRSGSTIVAAMALGMNRETALKFSFFLYIPVSVGGMILGAADLANDPDIGTLAIPYAVAFICSLIASYFALKWFMGIMARGNLKWFSFYCFIAGAAVLFLM